MPFMICGNEACGKHFKLFYFEIIRARQRFFEYEWIESSTLCAGSSGTLGKDHILHRPEKDASDLFRRTALFNRLDIECPGLLLVSGAERIAYGKRIRAFGFRLFENIFFYAFGTRFEFAERFSQDSAF